MMTTFLLHLMLIIGTYSDFPKIIEHGTNIHFTNPESGVAQEMSQAFGIIRMDFSWQGTEQKKGIYNFDSYDIFFRANVF